MTHWVLGSWVSELPPLSGAHDGAGTGLKKSPWPGTVSSSLVGLSLACIGRIEGSDYLASPQLSGQPLPGWLPYS